MNLDSLSLKLPLDASKFLESQKLEYCDLKESLAGHMHMLLTTSYGECKFDETYGCEIWDHEFEHSQISKVWIDKMALKIKSSLEDFETRLTDMVIEASITEEEMQNDSENKKYVRLQKCLWVKITGKLTSTNDAFYFTDKIYISPFAID